MPSVKNRKRILTKISSLTNVDGANLCIIVRPIAKDNIGRKVATGVCVLNGLSLTRSLNLAYIHVCTINRTCSPRRF